MRALVMSGGGGKGAYEAGALKHLLGDLNLQYNIICGVSVGALNTALLGMYNKQSNDAALDSLLKVWYNIKTSDVYKSWFPFGRLSALWKKSLYNSQPLQDLVRSRVNLNTIRQSGRKLAVGAVSLTTGNYKVFTQDDDRFIDGVLASSAFPAFLTPIQIGNELFTDGGVKHITPLKSAIDLGADTVDIIMCSPPMTTAPYDNNAKTSTLAMRAIELMSDEILYNDIQVALLYNDLVEAGLKPNKRKVQMSLINPAGDLTANSLDFSHDLLISMMNQGYADAVQNMQILTK